jgi:hypothetical protein
VAINRRRAPSSEISSAKKLAGHDNEKEFADYIKGQTISGTGKTDVIDKNDFQYSVKSGKKWQIFLYGYERIANSTNLSILKPCLDAFPVDYSLYLKDRETCIEFKENYVRKHGKLKAQNLSNEEVHKKIGSNSYIEAKLKLSQETAKVKKILSNMEERKKFLEEAIFNNEEVELLSIKDQTNLGDKKFKVFSKVDVLKILSEKLFPETSNAGNAPEDFNVSGQKTLFCYLKENKSKNIVEIEIRNDSQKHYRQVRFNMYSRDTLSLLYDKSNNFNHQDVHPNVRYFGNAINFIE